ncbi:MAG TPA: ABC transporter permease [bacterium]|nr:ABC transporter permease [bacterium]
MAPGPITELWLNRRLLWQMTVRDFRSKYAGSLMGVFWTLINPLLLLAVFTFIFTVVFKARFGPSGRISVSALYILCGILPWLAFQEGIARAGTVVIENRNLVTRARFPLSVLPAHPALAALLGQLAGFAILMAMAGVTVHAPAPTLAVLPLLLCLQLLFTIGLAMIVSAVSAYVRDVAHVIPLLLLVWFYATPVFYPADLVPDRYRIIIALNPLAGFISAYRASILDAVWPDPASLISLAAFALAALLAGAFCFKRLAPGFSDRL